MLVGSAFCAPISKRVGVLSYDARLVEAGPPRLSAFLEIVLSYYSRSTEYIVSAKIS